MGKTLLFAAHCALAAASAALTAVPAASQSLGVYGGTSKSEAILGGQSALAAIMAQQSGKPTAQPLALTPSGYSLPFVRAAMPVYRPVASPDRPDVFGSVALPVGRTSLDRRWRAVSGRRGVGALTAAYAGTLKSLSPLERLEAVNRYVNARVQFVNDDRQYNVADLWTSAAETLGRGKGDCEDYAIAKLQMLRRAGFADRDLYLVIVRDLLRRADHAVLVARAEGRLVVLDNGTDRLIDSYEMRDYRPVMTFSANQAWTHGYRREAPTYAVASNDTLQSAALSVAAVAPVVPSALAN